MSRLNFLNLSPSLYYYGFLYPTPTLLSYYWNFGFLAGRALFIQLVTTGIALTFCYIGNVDVALSSVEFLMREVFVSWLLHDIQSKDGLLFFVVVYLHIGRNLFFGSYTYPRENLWFLGVMIFLCMIITTFLGYVLPWGPMSYWAATVITSLLSVVPFIGEQLLFFVWCGIFNWGKFVIYLLLIFLYFNFYFTNFSIFFLAATKKELKLKIS